jgi:hypothetical protein
MSHSDDKGLAAAGRKELEMRFALILSLLLMLGGVLTAAPAQSDSGGGEPSGPKAVKPFQVHVPNEVLSLPTLPDVPSATSPGQSTVASLPRSWLFLDCSHPRSERIPSGARSRDRSRPRSVELPANLEAAVASFHRSQYHLFPAYATFLSTPPQVGRLWILA